MSSFSFGNKSSSQWGKSQFSFNKANASSFSKFNPPSQAYSFHQNTKKAEKAIPPPPDAYFSLDPEISSLPQPEDQPKTEPASDQASTAKESTKTTSSSISSSKEEASKEEKKADKENPKKSKNKKTKSKKEAKKPRRTQKKKTRNPLNDIPFMTQPFLPPINIPQPSGPVDVAAFEEEILDDAERIINEVLETEVQESEFDQFIELLSPIIKNYVQSCIKNSRMNSLPPSQFNQFGPSFGQMNGFGLNSPFMPQSFGLGQQFMNPGMMPFNQQPMQFPPFGMGMA